MLRQMSFMQEGKMAPLVTSLNAYCYGYKSAEVDAALKMWNMMPAFNVVMCEDLNGYGSDGVVGFYQICEFKEAAGLDAWSASPPIFEHGWLPASSIKRLTRHMQGSNCKRLHT